MGGGKDPLFGCHAVMLSCYHVHMKLNYLIIPLAVLAVSVIGSMFTGVGIGSGWYSTIAKPEWTPPGSVIGTVWTTIFVLTAASALIAWNKAKPDARARNAMIAYGVNGGLNLAWSYIFFARHWLGLAVFEAGLLGLSVVVIMVLVWKRSRVAALLLIPYAVWVSFATFLNYIIWRMN